MAMWLTRRDTIWTAAAIALTGGPAKAETSPHDAFAELERRLTGRIGVMAVDTGSGRHVGYRAEERLPLCSTFKLIAAGLVLRRVDRGEERLDRRIVFGRDVVVVGSPLTGPRAGGDGMSMAEICRAAITRSDNTAGNLMLASFGGPPALTAFARSLGDPVTRLDRNEPTLNEALPGDPRDTTTPQAMVDTMRHLLLGEALSESSKTQLTAWLDANETGGTRIRAGAPSGWRIGDKTGTGERGAAGDVAVLSPPQKPPILMAIYTAGSAKPIGELNAAIAEAARIALRAVA